MRQGHGRSRRRPSTARSTASATIIPGSFRMPPGGLNIRTQRPSAWRRKSGSRAQDSGGRSPSCAPTRPTGWCLPAAGGRGSASSRRARAISTSCRRSTTSASTRCAPPISACALLKLACTWPIEPETVRRFAEGLETIIVVEEKRAADREPDQGNPLRHRQPAGHRRQEGRDAATWLFPAKGALDPQRDRRRDRRARARAGRPTTRLAKPGRDAAGGRGGARARATTSPSGRPISAPAARTTPRTVVPEGSRAYAGIGCHYMAQCDGPVDRGLHPDGRRGRQLGRRGAVLDPRPRLPEHRRRHLQPLRQPRHPRRGRRPASTSPTRSSSTTPSRMTGGQPVDGGLTVAKDRRAGRGRRRPARRRRLRGARQLSGGTSWPFGTTVHHRDDDSTRCSRSSPRLGGVSVLIYDQTCAAEKRRRRKRGLYPDPDRRVVINELVCEGCGDCGVQSNCVAIVPVETEFGRKRAIDQSTCNKDFSCLKGFCPSFVTVHGAVPRKRDGVPDLATALPEPKRVPTDGELRHPDHRGRRHRRRDDRRAPRHGRPSRGQGAAVIDMAGLAQKGGAVTSHVRIAPHADDIKAIRVAGGRRRRHPRLRHGGRRLGQVARRHRSRTDAGLSSTRTRRYPGDFTRDADFTLPTRRLLQAITGARRRRADARHRRDARRRRRSSATRSRPTSSCSASPGRRARFRCRARRSSGRSS